MLVTELVSHFLREQKQQQQQQKKGMRRLGDVPSISKAFRLSFHPPSDGGKQGNKVCVRHRNRI